MAPKTGNKTVSKSSIISKIESGNKAKKSTVMFADKSKTQLHGGISVKDDPDKIDKEDYESDEEVDENE
jgi:hypothetical protein